MNTSILEDVKGSLGIPKDEVHFDRDIIMHINTSMFILNHAGVGPKQGYSIKGSEETWIDYLGEEEIHAVKTYIYLNVRVLFDPPEGGSAILESMQRTIEELLWRLSVYDTNV